MQLTFQGCFNTFCMHFHDIPACCDPCILHPDLPWTLGPYFSPSVVCSDQRQQPSRTTMSNPPASSPVPPRMASMPRSNSSIPSTTDIANKGARTKPRPMLVIPEKYQRKTAPHVVHSGDHAEDFDYRKSPNASPIMGAFMTAKRTASTQSIGEPMSPLMSPGMSRTSMYDPNHGHNILSPVEMAAKGVGTLFGSLERIVRNTPTRADAADYFSMSSDVISTSMFSDSPQTERLEVAGPPMQWYESMHSVHAMPASGTLNAGTLLGPAQALHIQPVMMRSRSMLHDLALPLNYYIQQIQHRATKLAKKAVQLGLEDWDVLDNQCLDEMEAIIGGSSPVFPSMTMPRSTNHVSLPRSVHTPAISLPRSMTNVASTDGDSIYSSGSDVGDKGMFRKMHEFNAERDKRIMDLIGMTTLPQSEPYVGPEDYLTNEHRLRIGGLLALEKRLAQSDMASDGWGGISGENARTERLKRVHELLALYGVAH